MRTVITAFIGLVAITCVSADAGSPGADQKAARIALVQEFVREARAIYQLQETATKEFAAEPADNAKLMTSIRVGTRTRFEMNESVNRLGLIPVAGQWAEIRDLLAKLHQERAALVQELTDSSKALLSGPQPGVNYGALMARAPELTAEMEGVDKGMFKISEAMFFALVDEGRLGTDGKLHHLLLTKTERTSMAQSIEKSFGAILEDKNAPHIVLAAWAIKYGLTRPIYKAADEP